MDKVLSTRLNEKVIAQLEFATKKLGITKKQFLEEAIALRAKETTIEDRLRVLQETFGAWKRDDETPEETVANIRRVQDEEWEQRKAYFDSLSRDQ
jgi:hypothetical protein